LVRRGVLSQPASRAPVATAVVLLPAGLKYHVGPSRLNVLLTRALVLGGFTVLCFDPLGVGESDGSLGPAPVRELWRSVEQGRFVDDCLLAARELRSRFGFESVVMGGLCGGAVTALLAAARMPEVVNGVISLNTAVTLSADAGAPKVVGAVQARHHMKSYLRKLLAPAAWARLLRRESDLAGIWATLRAAIRARLPGHVAATHVNENPAFIESFRRLTRGQTPHLLLFSGNDNRWLEFQEIVLQRYLAGDRAARGYRIEVVERANHELHWKAWQDQAIAAVCGWVRQEFGGAAPGTTARASA
jgi:pimeloyl-ACP methyl ester carboxylesterase